MSIMEYFPGEPRDVQREILLDIEQNYDSNDVLVINAPVAVGKSRVAITIGRWLNATGRGATQIITPSNLLVKQYESEFPELNVLHKKSSYKCKRSTTLSCTQQLLKRNLGSHCPGCTMTSAKRDYGTEEGISLANTYLYKAHRIYKPNLIIDEAHTTIQFIRDMRAKTKWQSDIGYPAELRSYGQLVDWLRKHGDMDKFLEECGFNDSPKYLIQPSRELRGRGFNRKYEPCLQFKPLDVSKAPPYLWPYKSVKKVILMSATIGAKDIEYLGLGNRRVYTIKCLSPILAARRPVKYEPIGSMSYATQAEQLPKLAAKIRELLNRHEGEKGLIHVTYSLAAQLRPYLDDEPRLMWHNKYDKRSQYTKFRATEPGGGAVFIASGLQEGVDLAGDAGRWQLIAKIPWPSLADPVTAYLAEQDPQYYLWETLKLVLQASGRICRRLDDYGITYITDSSFKRLITEGAELLPDYFKDSLELGD